MTDIRRIYYIIRVVLWPLSYMQYKNSQYQVPVWFDEYQKFNILLIIRINQFKMSKIDSSRYSKK